MPVGRERRLAMARRRQQVAELTLKGWTQWAIAKELGVAQSTVSADIRALEKQWLASAARDFDLARAVILQSLDCTLREAWAGWERSKQPREWTKVIQDGSGRRVEKRIEQRPGDPRFLEQVRRCIDSRRELLGLDVPPRKAESLEGAHPGPYSFYEGMRRAQIASKTGPPPVVIDDDYIERFLRSNMEKDGSAEPSPPSSAPEGDAT